MINDDENNAVSLENTETFVPSLAEEEAPAPAEEAPAEEAPVEEAPVEEAPVEEAPVEEAPVEEAPAPAEEAPVEEAPVEEAPAPAEEAPVEEAPAEEAPVEEAPAPAEEAPVEEAPAEEAPVEEAPAEEAPVEEAPAEEAPVEEAPVEEAPVEEAPAPAEEAPVEEAPVEEAPAEEAPVEEAPAPVEETPAPVEEEATQQMDNIYPPENITFSIDNPTSTTPSLVFIVPYRNRQKQYEFYANHMKTILEDIDPNSYRILYIHQQDEREFNRGAMKNIGFITVKNMYPDTYQNITLVFNDIDIMPYTKNFLNYYTTTGIVKHFYGFTFALGGLLSITAGDFEKINGFPNFWAWGYEDNALQNRVTAAGLTTDRSQFYPILDPNMLHFSEGITRNMNRTEFDLFLSNTTEGINSISNIQSNLDESTGFVNVTYFYTPREENSALRQTYDLRDGAMPFKVPAPAPRPGRRNPAMRMML
jgi:chemotaxis protein histidine kinase CheA